MHDNGAAVVGQASCSDCKLRNDSRCAISSMMFWFCASVSIMRAFVYDDNNNNDNECTISLSKHDHCTIVENKISSLGSCAIIKSLFIILEKEIFGELNRLNKISVLNVNAM